ncbi:MAG TPA: gluconate 2-dehydrogenase subunit 3 family protein [Steroidobacteraceae bacterium]|nr:gluconate 2-dehydrogenase subunit 3 family protein [Steroidobacteraceae bacterium]
MAEHRSAGPERYPGYDVLTKRRSPSWNDKTREVIDARLRTPREPRFFDIHELATVQAIAAIITPQPAHRVPVPVAELIDHKLYIDRQDGYRAADMPRERTAWRRGIAALDAESNSAHGRPFRELEPREQEELLRRMEQGDLHDPVWGGMPPKTFFTQRLLTDVVDAYWSYPTAWSEMGYGGPASPRGYVRMGYDERDPWEPAEAHGDDALEARRINQRIR